MHIHLVCAHVLRNTHAVTAETFRARAGRYVPKFTSNSCPTKEYICVCLIYADGMRSERACETEIEDLRQELSNFAWFYYAYILMCGFEPFVGCVVSPVFIMYLHKVNIKVEYPHVWCGNWMTLSVAGVD